MPIIQALPDPRLQVFMDLVTTMQQARRREEEERAAEREAQSQRYWQIPATVIGAVLGGVGAAAVGGAAAGAGAAGAAAGSGISTATGAGAAISAAEIAAAATGAGAAATTGGILGGALTGAGFGSGVGQAFAGGDFAGGIQQAAQGIATLANLPALAQQGFSPLEVGMGGLQGLPNILADLRARRRQGERLTLQDAQISRRQQENLVRQEVVARRQRDAAFNALPPDAKATITTAQNQIAERRIDLRRGELTPDEFNQAISPHLVTIEETFRDKQPPPPPTIDEVIEKGEEISIRPELGGGFIRNAKGELKWFKTSPSFTALDRQELIEDKTKEFTAQFEEEEIASRQAYLLAADAKSIFAKLSAKEARSMAQKQYDALNANARIVAEKARQAAEQYVEGLMPASRLSYLRPTADETKQAQEGAKQQQEAAEQQQATQQQQAQEQQQQQQIEEAKVFFGRSAEALVGMAKEFGSDPNKWSKRRRDDARGAAEGLLRSLMVLAPMMSQKEKERIVPLVELAQAIIESDQTFGGG